MDIGTYTSSNARSFLSGAPGPDGEPCRNRCIVRRDRFSTLENGRAGLRGTRVVPWRPGFRVEAEEGLYELALAKLQRIKMRQTCVLVPVQTRQDEKRGG